MLKRPGVLTAALVAIFFGAEALAQGGPPLITDDPDTPGAGHWENNVAVFLDTSPDGSVIQAPNLDLNYGYGERAQLNLQTALATQRGRGLTPATGLTQDTFAVKYRFLEPANAASGGSLSVYPKLSLRGPGSSPSRALAPGAPAVQLPVEAKLAMGGLALVGEVGANLAGGSPASTFYGTVLGVSATAGVDLMLEMHGESDRATAGVAARSDWLVSLGTRCALSRSVDFIAAVGRYVKPAGTGPEGLVYAGVSLHTPEDERGD